MLIGFKRTVWQRLLWWRFRLFQRHRHERLVLEEVEGRPLLVLPGVMNPALFRTGPFLARYLAAEQLPTGCSVLDMGTGSGLLAIVAAAAGARRVVAVDVSQDAVRCARINVLLNRVEDQVAVRLGDLFAPVAGEQFDRVLFNPPFFPGEPEGPFDTAWRSSTVAGRFAAGLAAHLAPRGHALVVLSSQGEEAAFLERFRAAGLAAVAASRQDLNNEVLTIYRVSQPADGADRR